MGFITGGSCDQNSVGVCVCVHNFEHTHTHCSGNRTPSHTLIYFMSQLFPCAFIYSDDLNIQYEKLAKTSSASARFW